MRHTRSSILYHALLLTGVNFLLRGVSMLFQIYLSNRVGAAGVGLMQLIFTVEAAAMTFGLSGARVAAMYLCAEEYGRRHLPGVRAALRLCLRYGAVCSLLAAAVLFFAAARIASNWLHNPDAAGALRLVALGLPVNCCCAILGGYFTACNQVGRLVRVEVAERLACLALTMALLVFRSGFSPAETCGTVIFGGILTSLAACAALAVIIYRDLRCAEPDPGLQMGRRLRKLCLPLAASDYLRSGLRALEQFLIPWGLMRAGGSSDAAMAEYGMFGGMVFPILMFPAALLYALSDLLVPELARCRAEGSRRRVRHLTKTCLHMGLIYSGCVAGLLFVLSTSLGQLFYHREDVGTYLRLFAPMVLSLYTDAIVDGMLKGLGEQVACARYNTITSALDVAILFLCLPRFGLRAYLFSFFLTHLMNFALSLHRLLAVTGYLPSFSRTLRTLFSTAAATAVSSLLHVDQLNLPGILFCRSLLFCTVLLLVLLLTGAFSSADFHLLSNALCKKSSH